jgi:hypothetical protein
LVNARGERRAGDGVWTECIEDVVVDFCSLGRAYIGQVQLP